MQPDVCKTAEYNEIQHRTRAALLDVNGEWSIHAWTTLIYATCSDGLSAFRVGMSLCPTAIRCVWMPESAFAVVGCESGEAYSLEGPMCEFPREGEYAFVMGNSMKVAIYEVEGCEGWWDVQCSAPASSRLDVLRQRMNTIPPRPTPREVVTGLAAWQSNQCHTGFAPALREMACVEQDFGDEEVAD